METLAICIREKIPSCIRAPPPEPETITSGSRCRVASSTARVSFSPTTEPMLPMMKLLSVTPKTMRMPRMKPWPTIAASFSPVAACSALTRSGYGRRSLNPSGSTGCRSANHSSNVSLSRSWLIRSTAETRRWWLHSGQTQRFCSTCLRNSVAWQPSQRIQTPTGTFFGSKCPCQVFAERPSCWSIV